MSKIVMTQALCAAGYDPLAKEGAVYVANNGNPSEYPEEMKDAECIVVRIGHMNRAEIEAAPKLRVIGRSGIGYDSIDIAAANEHGIPVVIAPHCNADSVAEHTLALMFALASNLVECHNEAVKGNFEIRNSGKSFELQGLTVGIIGFGDIGKRVGRLCRALGMHLIAYDPFCSAEDVESHGAAYCRELSELLATSDIVTIHTPLSDDTRGLLGLEQLRLMKPTALLINCARGGIVDESALVCALKEGIIAGAGIDVTVEEPLRPENPLCSAPNLIISPHSAAQTKEATIRAATMCAEGCIAVLHGQRWPAVANPEAYLHPRWNP
nr:hydroxyacid dehydrogenase [uncultured Dysosmobacter sp.]